VVDISPPALSVNKNGGSAPLVFTVTGGSGAVALTAGVPNLEVTETSANHFTVTSLNNSRGDFTLYFSTPCGARQVTVTVTN
jgi:phosphatidate phosphatase APP1